MGWLIAGAMGLGLTHVARRALRLHAWTRLPLPRLAARVLAAGLVLGLLQFNCLNGPRGLIVEDPIRAQEVVTRLSGLLRYALGARGPETVTPRRELQVVDDYLGLEAIRLEERLRVRMDVAPDALGVPVPAMLVQTRVENAIKHGIAPAPRGGEVSVKARIEDRALCLEVANTPGSPVAGAAGTVDSGGVGLRNATERLRLLCGTGASLRLAPDVVFTTAYDTHALRAFQVNALDYLLKPIEPARLAEALERVRQRGRAQRAAGAPAAPLERVFVRDGERCWLVTLSQVPLFSSEGNYARLHLPDAEPLLARSLNHLEERLDPARFFRASRQHLINLHFVEALEPGPGGTLVARLRGGREVEMSRRQSQRFRERLSP
ncbi:LytTR family transcriptional regulator DNA-binding domain-containing protein [Corallococcus exercitus]|uniref:LytTR family transcriptional regulator DNA-binding domain-containing protein n=1 Tax=Corallococcus exercitus TaxID=2316736 RepID=UPI0035D46F62